MSVMTVNEETGLGNMANGSIPRSFTLTEIVVVAKLRICSHSRTIILVIPLDIWYFVQQIAAGCNTEAHQVPTLLKQPLLKGFQGENWLYIAIGKLGNSRHHCNDS